MGSFELLVLSEFSDEGCGMLARSSLWEAQGDGTWTRKDCLFYSETMGLFSGN